MSTQLQALQRCHRRGGFACPHVAPCTRPSTHIARIIIDPSGLAKGNVPGFRKVSSLEELGPNDRPQDEEGVEKVPASELPQPHPKAQKTLSKALNKAGAYKALTDTLASVSFTIASDDQELAWSVAQGLGKRLGYFPTSTARVLAGMHKVSGASPAPAGTGGVGGSLPDRAALVAALGSEEALAQAERRVLTGLRSQKRVMVCTLPGGALSHPEAWTDVWGSFIVWLDEEDKTDPKPKTAERKLLSQRAEAVVRLKTTRGFQGGKQTAEGKAATAIEATIKELVKLLNKQSDIVERKTQYVAYGCRGDWPQVQPQDWNPLLDGLQRKPVEGTDKDSSAA